MKNVLIIIALFVCTTGAMAQTEKGRFRVGGDVDLSFLNSDFDKNDYKVSEFNLDLNGGYFLINDLSLDVGLFYNREKVDGYKDADSQLGAEIGARYYLPFKLVFGASFDVIVYDSGESVTGTGFNLKAGYAWFVKDNIAIEPGVQYRIGLSDEDDGTKCNNFGVKVGLSFYF